MTELKKIIVGEVISIKKVRNGICKPGLGNTYDILTINIGNNKLITLNYVENQFAVGDRLAIAPPKTRIESACGDTIICEDYYVCSYDEMEVSCDCLNDVILSNKAIVGDIAEKYLTRCIGLPNIEKWDKKHHTLISRR